MRKFFTGVVVSLAIIIFVPQAHAQKVTKSTLSGIVTSSSAAIPANSSAPVYTTPAAGMGFFILKQLCTNVSNCIRVSGNTFGTIPTFGSGACFTYDPGIALPAAEVLTGTESCGQTAAAAMVT